MAVDDKYGLEPATNEDDKYGLEPAGTATATAAPTDEEIDAAYGKDVTPTLRAALKSGVAPMTPPTAFEQRGGHPAPESFGEWAGRRTKEEEKKPFWHKVVDAANPFAAAEDVSEGLGALGESAERKAKEEETKDLGAIAHGAQPGTLHKPFGQQGMTFDPATAYHVLGSIGRIGSGVVAPESLGQLGAAAVAPEVMLPYFAYQGAKMLKDPALKYIKNSGEPGTDWTGGLTPEEMEQGLVGGSMLAGSVGGVGEGIKEAGGVKPYVRDSITGRVAERAVTGRPITDAGRVNEAVRQILEVKPPGMNDTEYRARVQAAVADLQDIAARNAGKIKTPRDARNAINERINQIEAPIGDHVADVNVEVHPDQFVNAVSDRIDQALAKMPGTLSAEERAAAKARVMKWLGEKPRSLRELEGNRRRLNDDAEKYYKSDTAGKNSIDVSDATAIAQRAAGDAIRDLLYGNGEQVGLLERSGLRAYDEAGNPINFRDVRRRIGNLLEIRDHFEDAINKAERQGDWSPFGALNKGPSLAAGGLGALWGLMSGHLVPGVIAGEAAKAFGEFRNPKNINKATERAFSNLERTAPKRNLPAINIQAPQNIPEPQFPSGQGAIPPSTAPVQGPQEFGSFDMMHPPGRTGMWEQQVGAPPDLTWGRIQPKEEPITPNTEWKLGRMGAIELPPAERTLPAPRPQLEMPGAAEVRHPGMQAGIVNSETPRALEAQRQVFREPESGRMARGFTAEGKPLPIGHTAEGGGILPEITPPELARKAVGTPTPVPEGLTPFMEDLVRKAGKRLTEQEEEAAYNQAKERGFNISKNDFLERLREVPVPAKALGTIGEKVGGAGREGVLGKINTTPAENLEVGDTFVDEKGDPRRIIGIEDDGTIKTADHTMRDYPQGEVKHLGEINSPKAQLARGGRFHAPDEPVEIYRGEEEKAGAHDLGEIGNEEPTEHATEEVPVREPRTTPKLSPSDAIEALKKRIDEVNSGNSQTRDWFTGKAANGLRIVKAGELTPQMVGDTSFILDDGSALVGGSGIRSHMQLAREVGQDLLNDANAVRVAAPDSFELHGMPSEAQLAEMNRLVRDIPREERTTVHSKNIYWDFYPEATPEEMRGYSADALHLNHETDQGSFSDFRRAMDKYYTPTKVKAEKIEGNRAGFNQPIKQETLDGGRVKLMAGSTEEAEAALEKETKNAPAEAKKEFPAASEKVSDLTVRKSVPNLQSIGSTFSEYQVQKGVREVPMSELGEPQKFANAKDNARVRELAKQIEKSGEIDPLIVVKDSEGYYVLEGGHRLGALQLLGKESVPAIVVEDLEKGKVYEQASTPEKKGAEGTEKRPKNLLGVSADAKTVKGEEQGYLTGIMYLAPADTSEVMNVCANASEGCKASCLNTAGRAGIFPNIIKTRVAKTKWMVNDPVSFKAQLSKDIEALVRKSARDGMTPAVRINGTSDLPKLAWEMAEKYPDVQFYDYTKHPRPWEHTRPNYHLTFSLSETNEAAAREALAHGINVAVPFFVKRGAPLPKEFLGVPVIDGDLTDLRFLDQEKGVVVGLRAKGRAKKDVTGFVKPNPDLVQIKPATGKPATPEEKLTAPQTRHEQYLDKSRLI